MRKYRYILQFGSADGGWYNQRVGSGNVLYDVERRYWDAIARGKATLGYIRIWDDQEFKAVTVQPFSEVRIKTDEERAASAARAEAASAANEAYWAAEKVRVAEAIAAEKVLIEAAREALKDRELAGPGAYDNLDSWEQHIIGSSLSEAYYASDIDGYGDEGAGYDIGKFAENLLALGWVYQPQSK